MRRIFACFLFLSILEAGGAHAQYPNRPVKVVVPFTPGSGIDILALVLHPSVPARSVVEFVAVVRAPPGRVNYASPGNATD